MNEREGTPERVVNENEKNLKELKDLFKNSLDNVFVRGSLVRGDKPYGDVDLNVYNEGGTIKSPEFPKKFHGITMSYRAVPLEHLDDYFDVCLRGTSTLTETIELHCENPRVTEIFKNQKEKLIKERRSAYLVYLQLEEALMRQLAPARDINKSADRKEYPGGKRTLSRIVWSLKALNPDFYETNNTEELTRIFEERGLMSPEFAEKFRSAFFASSEDVSKDEFITIADEITVWFDQNLVPRVQEQVKEQLPPELVIAANDSINFKSNKEVLYKAYEYSQRDQAEHQKWLILWALSTNISTPPEILVDIYNKYKYSHSYKHVVRNLFGNHVFPINEVDLNGLSFDSIAQETYQKRAQRYKEVIS